MAVTDQMLDDFLRHFTPFEQSAKDYYETNHTFFTDKTIPDEFVRYFSIPPMDLRNLTETAQIDTIHAKHSPFDAFVEHHFFSPDYDIYIQKQPRYSSTPMQVHHFFEICYQYSGHSMFSVILQGQREIFTLKEGDFIFIPQSCEHASMIDSDSIMLDIGLRTSTFEQAFAHNLPPDSMLVPFFSRVLDGKEASFILFRTNADPQVHKLVMELSRTYCTHALYASYMMNLQLSLLFLYLIQNHSAHSQILTTENQVGTQIPAILHYMEMHYATVSVQELSAKFGYSTDYINYIFKKHTGKTLSETILTLKMQKAGTLLKNTSLSINEIAEHLGYQNPTNLIRSFRKYYGITPAKYRKSEETISPQNGG